MGQHKYNLKGEGEGRRNYLQQITVEMTRLVLAQEKYQTVFEYIIYSALKNFHINELCYLR